MAYAKDKEQMITLSLYMTPEEYEELKDFCNNKGWSVAGLLKQNLAQLKREISQTTKHKERSELPLTILN
ncbi:MULTISPECIES: hypothetical protein [Yersinia]|uniref:Uncharacterized protein n=1 Tax=Yersinia kristensenii TaxID=28152 RepID=A0A0T9M4N3_YERKR|nr:MULTISPECIES: hypothetical protein [Yersinia]EKN5112726.1 hypothetical protein [Yersinia enterocolitica]MBW5879024.1 hypothetical protein [Yersinia enterocolitica]MDN0102074.1 hypothetical protein [Yersinia bercovieri]CNF58280.1 Uncharacterised protein [Yersinia kristensenii]HDL6925441.1 hypothetical protein [Yersinia enterocolitica]